MTFNFCFSNVPFGKSHCLRPVAVGTLAQQGIKNVAGQLKMMVAAHSGMFRGLNQSPQSPPAHDF